MVYEILSNIKWTEPSLTPALAVLDIVFAVEMAVVPSTIIFLMSRKIFFLGFDFQRGVKMNLRIITKNHAPDPEIGILTKSISKAYGRATAKPTAWELKEIEKR